MLVASILKVFYWFGAYYDTSLLIQACIMIVVQLVLLKVALDNRGGSVVQHEPFRDYNYSVQGGLDQILSGKRPWDFWRWRDRRIYFQVLAYFTGVLLAVHVLLPWVSANPVYISFLGYVGLAVEAILPLPQIYKNHTARSCKGFRLSVIVNWLAGDAMKMSYFFLSTRVVTWPFRLCGMFQACCDAYLGLQFWMYGSERVGLGGGRGDGGSGLGGLVDAKEVQMGTMGAKMLG